MSKPVWLITAAGSGFGKHIARQALSLGHSVVATGRRLSTLEDLHREGATILALDVTIDQDNIKQIVDKIAGDHGGRIDYLINAAGYALVGAIEEVSPEETLACFNTNVLGMMNVTRAVLPHMRARKAGVVAIFGSLGSWIGSPAGGVYCATKWACSALAESLRMEVEGFGIAVVSVEPGYFRTGFLNPGARVESKGVLREYGTGPVAETRKAFDAYDNQQPGDVVKGAQVIVDVLTRKVGKEIPVRLVLGSDCRVGIKQKCEQTLELLEEWKDVSASTDYS